MSIGSKLYFYIKFKNKEFILNLISLDILWLVSILLSMEMYPMSKVSKYLRIYLAQNFFYFQALYCYFFKITSACNGRIFLKIWKMDSTDQGEYFWYPGHYYISKIQFCRLDSIFEKFGKKVKNLTKFGRKKNHLL